MEEVATAYQLNYTTGVAVVAAAKGRALVAVAGVPVVGADKQTIVVV